jgi:hypothetical protein
MSCLFLILAGVTLGQISPFGLAHISANWFPPEITKTAGSSRGFTVGSELLAPSLQESIRFAKCPRAPPNVYLAPTFSESVCTSACRDGCFVEFTRFESKGTGYPQDYRQSVSCRRPGFRPSSQPRKNQAAARFLERCQAVSCSGLLSLLPSIWREFGCQEEHRGE